MIFTFYSYKGGVGRSMAMAGVAHLLARRGLRVLAIDFDLEAPGLERYFFDTERSRAVRTQQGLLDLILAYREALSSEAAFSSGRFRQWWNFRMTAIHVAGTLGGSVDLMTAGRREPETAKRDYALAVRSFDWQDFFHNWKGDLFFDWFRRQLQAPDKGYDVVLVDSRTGVTEMGGVCAYQLADVAVLLCAPNYQNLDGTLDVVRDFRSESVRALRRGRPLEILALPARVEATHPGRAAFLELFKQQLGVEGLPAVLAQAGLDYEKLALPYLSQFAVAEQLVGEAPRNPLAGVSDVFEALADALTLLAEPDTPLGRQRHDALKRLTGDRVIPSTELLADATRSSAGYDAFIDCSPQDVVLAQELVAMLESAGHRIFLDREQSEAGQNVGDVIGQALAYSAVLLVCFGQATPTEWRARTIAQARRLQTVTIVPVLLPGSDPHVLASFDLGEQQAVDLRDPHDPDARERLLRIVAAASQPRQSTAAIAQERDPYPGARAFTEDDAAYFVGREQQIELLLAQLRSHDVIVVTGAAQVGKSSLVQAGLLPRLRLVDEGDPLHFDVIESISLPQAPGAKWKGPAAEGKRSSLWLVDGIDSFDEDGSAPARAERLAILERVLASAGGGRKIVLVGRDAMSAPERMAWHALLQERGAAWLEVEPLTGSALARAIEEPARRAGHLLEPGLAERLVESAGSPHNAIAQIQLALATIWPERKRGWMTNKNLDAAGHLDGIMAARRRAVLASLKPQQQEAAGVLFTRLVALSASYVPVSSPQPWESIATIPALQWVDAVALRDKLAGAALIDLYVAKPIGAQDEGGPRELRVALARPDVSVYWSEDKSKLDLRFLLWRDPVSSLAWRWNGHNEDALLRGAELAEAQHWMAERVDQLTQDERAFIDASTAAQEAADREREARDRERLAAAEALAAEQVERVRLEQLATLAAVEHADRLRRGRRWMLGLLAASCTMAAYALYQTEQARQAMRATNAALNSARESQRGTELALESARAAQRAAEAALAARTEQARATANRQLESAYEKLIVANQYAGNVRACPGGQQLYLHITQESDRQAARALMPALEKGGFTVPGIELVNVKLNASDVRYFRQGEQAAANRAAGVLRDAGVTGLSVKFISGYEDSTRIGPCHYEAWLAPEGLPAPKR